ncbi:hypothetical protein PIB30_049243 [Stylosanthes scabra]|uniref:Putative plant transposon protein domain-containing protein n=1 Tax=Stylosanthes scabra TaxID=79078 RepID=A0ABU6SH38_9FABA|nr:hypothetical protein [Stylosanthes scabra]
MAAEEGLDAHCFRTLFNQRLYEETVCRKKIIPEVGFNIREGLYPELREKILKRGWRRLASPRSEVAKAMIREFYANVARTEEQVAGLDQYPYTSYVRGVEIDFSPENIRKCLEICAKREQHGRWANGGTQLELKRFRIVDGKPTINSCLNKTNELKG